MDDLVPPLSYAPDGLYESDIDALLTEYFGPDHGLPEVDTTVAPAFDRVAEHRHIRRISRQTINAALRSVRASSTSTDNDAAA
ncbi:hypothetical protein ORV05_34725 [Amycolatopsis cynarae]|uniref:Uncharacterized protein n=1 Tax=Amycolatopsis cynarae TaxID=2995223 RepID=A0ABY7B0X4_9PSEU|nr:hypothetical protein [Amycolatopsis sp. HUAS 11-8]WAL65951.1 hypothetical protein ORV05_34725 [Amycolatopsis sp. HUAS 11-8]